MNTTAAMRATWGPPCRIRVARFTFHSGVTVTVDARTIPVWQRLDAIFEAFGYRPRKNQTWGYACRAITGGKGYSLHAYGIAVDVNSLTNPYGRRLVTDMPAEMVKAIEAVVTVEGVRVLGWGGRYSGMKDAMHFEVICTPAQLAKGLAGSPVSVEDDLLTEEEHNLLVGTRMIAEANKNAIAELAETVAQIRKSTIADSEWRQNTSALLAAIAKTVNPA